MADPFRDPQGIRAYAADIFCMLYRPLRGIEKDGCPPYRIPTRKFRRARAGASSQAAIGRRCRFAVATEPCREPPTLGNAPFPSYQTARSPRFCVAAPAQLAGDPGISSRSKGINRAMCPCGPRRSFAGANGLLEIPATNRATFPENKAIPAGGGHDALSRDAMMARGCAAASPRAAQAHGVAPSDEGCRRAFGLICVISAGGRAITRGGQPKPLSCLAIPAPGARGTIS